MDGTHEKHEYSVCIMIYYNVMMAEAVETDVKHQSKTSIVYQQKHDCSNQLDTVQDGYSMNLVLRLEEYFIDTVLFLKSK